MFGAIRYRFAGKDVSKHFITKDFGLSNASPDPKFKELRETITEVAKQQTYWGELKPAKWIHLEKMLEDLRKNGVEVHNNIHIFCCLTDALFLLFPFFFFFQQGNILLKTKN